MSHGAAAVSCCVRVIGTCVTCVTSPGHTTMTRRGGGEGKHRKVCRGTCRDMGKLRSSSFKDSVEFSSSRRSTDTPLKNSKDERIEAREACTSLLSYSKYSRKDPNDSHNEDCELRTSSAKGAISATTSALFSAMPREVPSKRKSPSKRPGPLASDDTVSSSLYLWHRHEDICRYPWYITRDIAAVIFRVIYHGYLRISRVNFPKLKSVCNSERPVAMSLFLGKKIC